MIKSLCLFLVLTASTSACFAADFVLHGQAFSLLNSKKWEKVLPNDNNLILQGPTTGTGGQPVVFVSNTDLKDVQFDSAGMQVRIDSYNEGRRKYINSKGGQLIGFVAYEKHAGPKKSEFHSTGVDYQIGHEIYHERSVFVSCNGSVFHVKTLDFQDPAKPDSANTLGKTFKCGH